MHAPIIMFMTVVHLKDFGLFAALLVKGIN
jgi:hypothetical protein